MIPKATTDICPNAPPENISMRPKSVSPLDLKKAESAAASIPGVGMWLTTR